VHLLVLGQLALGLLGLHQHPARQLVGALSVIDAVRVGDPEQERPPVAETVHVA
jgi:hypothetical protein